MGLPFFTYNEVPAADLHKFEQDYDFMVCVDAKFTLNDKYGQFFDKRYNIGSRLQAIHGSGRWQGKGYCVRLPHIFALVVDANSVENASPKRLREALLDAHRQGMKRVFMPRWVSVPAWNKYKDVLMNTLDGDIEILVVYAVEEDGVLIILDPDVEKQGFKEPLNGEVQHKYY